MRYLLPLLLLVATPAAAHPIDLTDREIDTVIAIANECVKAKGFDCVDAAIYIRDKLNEARKPKPQDSTRAP